MDYTKSQKKTLVGNIIPQCKQIKRLMLHLLSSNDTINTIDLRPVYIYTVDLYFFIYIPFANAFVRNYQNQIVCLSTFITRHDIATIK